MSALVCLGLGYCARFYVAEFGTRFDHVVGTSRSTDKVAPSGVMMLAFDGIQPSPELREAISDASASPDFGGARRNRRSGAGRARGRHRDRAKTAIDRLSVVARRLWRSRRRLDRRDRADHSAAHARRRACRRRTGLAGARPETQHAGRHPPARRHLRAGQNAFVRLLAGRAHRIDKPGHVSNRIHVADIAQAIEAAFARRFDGIVNVTDGAPAPPGDQIEFAAKLLGVSPPPLLSLEEAKRTLSPFLMSFYDGCARIRNDKLKTALGVTLRYPDYRAGLQALLDDGFEAPPITR